MTKHATGVGFRRRKGNQAAATGQGRFDAAIASAYRATGGRDPVAIRRFAELAGGKGRSATPMDNARRAENYRRQRGGVAPVLTDRQRRRLRKNGLILADLATQ